MMVKHGKSQGKRKEMVAMGKFLRVVCVCVLVFAVIGCGSKTVRIDQEPLTPEEEEMRQQMAEQMRQMMEQQQMMMQDMMQQRGIGEQMNEQQEF